MVNAIPQISEIKGALDLGDFTREWHNKRTKLSRQFWSLVLHTIYGKDPKPFNPFLISGSYMYLFYRPFEINHTISSHYNGFSTSQLKNQLDFNAEKQLFKDWCNSYANQLYMILQSVGIKSQSSGIFEINTTEFDSHHPYLDKVSECFKRIIDYGEITVLESKAYTLPFDVTPTVSHQLDEVADKMIQSELFYMVLGEIEHALDHMSTFSSKKAVDSPMDALRDVIKSHPDLWNYSDQQICYLIPQKYILTSGTFDHIQKSVKRERQRLE